MRRTFAGTVLGSRCTVVAIAALTILTECFAANADGAFAQQSLINDYPNRDAYRTMIRNFRKISTPEGIDELHPIKVNGTLQWISIRGRNRLNPVILFIHGGPGDPMMPWAWSFQNPWEDYFTVVQWDQRGAGKNAASFDFRHLARTLTVAQQVRDAEAVTDYLRKHLQKKKIVILGFSWGSMIGTALVKQRPAWVSAYVGVGQGVAPGDEAVLYQTVVRIAKKDRNAAALAQLKAIAPYPKANGSTPISSALAVRKWVTYYNGAWYGHNDNELYELPALSPEYSKEDIVAYWSGGDRILDIMDKAIFTYDMHDLGKQFAVPMLFFEGRYDLDCPYSSALAYYNWIKAPKKQFVTFERSGHIVMLSEPGRFLVELVNRVLPLTEGEAVYRESAYPGHQ